MQPTRFVLRAHTSLAFQSVFVMIEQNILLAGIHVELTKKSFFQCSCYCLPPKDLWLRHWCYWKRSVERKALLPMFVHSHHFVPYIVQAGSA
jgi:hypothetical protein